MFHLMSVSLPNPLSFLLAQITCNTSNQARPFPSQRQLDFQQAQYHILQTVTLLYTTIK